MSIEEHVGPPARGDEIVSKTDNRTGRSVRVLSLLIAALLQFLLIACVGFGRGGGGDSSRDDLRAALETLDPGPQWLWMPPVSGLYGKDFLVAPYRDNAPETGVVMDFTGGDRAYDGHPGTDYAIPGFAWQDAAVPVVAVAAGIVTEVIDGYPDRETQRDANRPDNFVRIDHGAGRSAYYAHFRTNSIVVAEGDWVEAGSPLGLIGSSGNSQWPHVHLSVIENGKTIDPYHGSTNTAASRWKNQHAYDTSTRPVDSGFFIDSPSLPDPQERLSVVIRGTENVRMFLIILAEKAGIVRRYELYDPDGTRVNSWEKTVERNYNFSRDWWWTRRISERVGRWEVRVYHNDQLIATNAIEVVEAGGSAPDELTAGITVDLTPNPPAENEPLVCQVDIEPHFGPAQGLRRYRYLWMRGAEELRDSTHSSRADVLPANALAAGDEVHCEVTLLVGDTIGETVRASAVVQHFE